MLYIMYESTVAYFTPIYYNIIRVRKLTDGAMEEEQSGFREGRGCADQIFTVRCLSEKYLEKHKDVYVAFMDLEKAYDRVDREAL